VEAVRKIARILGKRLAVGLARPAWSSFVRGLETTPLVIPGLALTSILVLPDRVSFSACLSSNAPITPPTA
jgi:hypothetical protein